MPLAISVNKKYFPALSKLDSLLSFHRSGLGNLKPAGGGPDGVADRKQEVEKAARGIEFEFRRRRYGEKVVEGRLRATSMVKGFVDAMMVVLVAIIVEGVVYFEVRFDEACRIFKVIHAILLVKMRELQSPPRTSGISNKLLKRLKISLE